MTFERDVWRAIERLAEVQARTSEHLEALAAAQARTEGHVDGLERAIERLTDAQVRTEERVGRLEERTGGLEAALQRLAEAQARSEERLTGVERAVERLAEAQARSEERLTGVERAVERLAEAQARSEERLQTLAEVQARTDRSVQQLSRQVGGLSETVGGDIEDIAYIVLHDVLAREFGWQVGVLERSWQRWNGQIEEIDVFGQATDPARPEHPIWIVGEAKHNLTASEVAGFARQVARARRHLAGEVFPVCFCYRARPEVQQAVRDAGLRLVFSYGKLV
ncbi:MAG: hypothetical protein ACRDJN_26540 [Chloroflexota bacterium]